MKILLTNNRLDGRGGTGPFLRDWSSYMQAQGHSVCCFSTAPSVDRRPIAFDLLPIARDLDRLPFVPDLIHGQHAMDAMAALAALPDVPGVFFAHGAVWQESPPVHPRIYEYLAVSETAAERMAVECGIDPSSIHVCLNTVDPDRFPTVRRLPDRPSRTLFYNYRHAPDSPTVVAAREAAARCGLSFDVVANVDEHHIASPETVLPTYDIVFASGVSAIDALASGCAVVVLGRTSCGELLLPDNYPRHRRSNFSIAVNSPAPDARAIEAQLRRYSAEACGQVALQLRQEADFRLAMPALETIYARVIDRHRTHRPDARADLLAIAEYLRTLTPLVAMVDSRRDGRWDLAADGDSERLAVHELDGELGAIAARARVNPASAADA